MDDNIKMMVIINSLLELQNIDCDLREMELNRNFLPGNLEEKKKEIEKAEEELANEQEQLLLLKKDYNIVSMNLESAQEKLKKHNKELYNVRTNREYDAVQMEIAKAKEIIAELEETAIELMEKMEQSEKNVEEFRERLKQVKKANKKEIETLEHSLSHIDEKIKEIEKKRELLAKQIPKSYLSTYNRIKRGAPDAVVPVRNRACGGCFNSLPPQTIQEIKRGDKLITCERCGRILYWAPGESDKK